MVKSSCLQLGELQDHPEYMEICCDTLNAEWRRSETARMYSLQRSSSSLPVSLILFDLTTREFIGHARLCRIMERTDACFIESVIIVPDRRGQGLGRELMALVEAYARQRSFKVAYLTSENKQSFYQRLGYSFCDPVTASSVCVNRIAPAVKPNTAPAVPPPMKPKKDFCQGANAPPPPPPPPALLTAKRLNRDWMMKVLVA